MRILAAFAYPALPVLSGVREGTMPDTYLMGLNHLGPDIVVDFIDPCPTKATDAMWKITRLSPLSERLFPANLLQQMRAVRLRRDYDALVIRDLKNIFLPALTQKFLRKQVYTLLLDAVLEGSGKLDFLLAPFLRGLDAVAYNSTAMRGILRGEIGIGDMRLRHLPYGVDTDFFSPMDVNERNGIVSVGNTNRDYQTLLRAIRSLGLRCDIYASNVLPLPGKSGFDLTAVPSQLATVSRVDLIALRRKYARAQIVVVPLHQTRTASGVTSLLEAMSMGKLVVVAETAGISDYIEDGRNVMTYRPGDFMDLARQIDYILQEEGVQRGIGVVARQHVLRRFSTKEEGHAIRTFLESEVSSGPDT